MNTLDFIFPLQLSSGRDSSWFTTPFIQKIPSAQKKQLLRNWPKIDLHCHLEGALTENAAQKVLKSNDLRLPANAAHFKKSLLNTTPSSSLALFLKRFEPVQFLFQNQNLVAKITRALLQDAADHNILHLELRFSPFFMAEKHQLNPIETLETVLLTGKKTCQELNISIAFILVADRHLGVDHAHKVLDMAIAHQEISGFDLASDEKNFPPELFYEVFEKAKQANMNTTCHAGEALGPKSVTTAIEMGAQRIGHGVRIIEDNTSVQLALKHNIPFEVCLSSNVQTGLYEKISDHPLRNLMQQGLEVTLNTDDPGICGISYTSELSTALEVFKLSLSELIKLQTTAIQHAFISQSAKINLFKLYCAKVTKLLNGL